MYFLFLLMKQLYFKNVKTENEQNILVFCFV